MDEVHRRGMSLTFREAPKLIYFRNRVINLYQRFIKNIKKYPIYFRNEKSLKRISNMCCRLGFGKSIDVLVLSNKELNDETIFGPHLESKTTHVADEESKTTHEADEVLVVCVASICKLDKNGLEATLSLMTATLSIQKKASDYLVICMTQRDSSEKETSKFREELVKRLPHKIAIYSPNIGFIRHSQNISTQVANMCETRITDALVEILMYVQFYVRNTYIDNQSIDIIESKSVNTTVKDYLINIYTMACVDCYNPNIEVLLERFARIFRCALVTPVATKHALPPSVINSIMCDMNLEENLSQKLSEQTRNLLSRRFIYAKKLLKTRGNSQRRTTFLKQDMHTNLVCITLLQESKYVFNKVEEKIASIQKYAFAFRKLMMEIKEYLLQTDAKHLVLTTDLISDGVPVELRKDILSIDGVYGVGTTYGQLEIHLDISTEDQQMKEKVLEILNRYRYGYGSKFKHVEKKP